MDNIYVLGDVKMKMEFNYETFTIEELENFELYDFICDGDTKKIKVLPNNKYIEISEFLYERYIERLKEKYDVGDQNV